MYVCVLGYVYARVSASRVLSSSNSISFADKHFCRQADRQRGMRERMSVCVSVCLFVRVCVFVGYSGQALGCIGSRFAFIFVCFSLQLKTGVLKSIFILDFSLI